MRVITPEEMVGCLQGSMGHEIREGHLHVRRMFQETIEYYSQMSEVLGIRAACPPGVLLDFVTDSPFVNVRGATYEGVGRICAHIDLVREHARVDSALLELNQSEFACRLQTGIEPGDVARRFRLWLPHSAQISLEAIEITKGAHFSAGTPSRILLALGDSITQGMDAVHPSATYAAVTATSLGMTLHNYAVGGAVYDAAILPGRPVESPTLITVAYGINDFNGGRSPDEAGKFLQRLHELYPDTPKAVLEPLWSSNPDIEGGTRGGITLPTYREKVRAAVESFDMMYWVPNSGLLPKEAALLADNLHPAPEGHLLLGTHLSRFLYESEKERIFQEDE